MKRHSFTPEDIRNALARPTYDLDYYLDAWTRWMRRDDSADLPDCFESHASGMEGALTNYMVSEDDSTILHDMMLATEGPIVQVCIDALDHLAQCALHHYHLFAVWRFPRVDFDAEYLRARAELTPLLRSRFLGFVG